MKRRISSIALLSLLVIALAIIPVLALTVSAAEETPTATLTFDDTSKRTEFSTAKQVWEENGIKLTNDKGSGNNIQDYSNPARFYKNSTITVEFGTNMTKLVLNCSGSSYAGLPEGDGATFDKSGTTITVTPSTPTTSITFTCAGGQIRLNSLVVYYESCEHTNTEDYYLAPTNEEKGYEGKKCSDCNTILSETLTEIPALGYNATFVAPGEKIPSQLGTLKADMPEAVEAPDAKYTFVGWATSEFDSTNSAPTLHDAGEEVPLKAHTTFYAVYSYSVSGATTTTTSYEKTDLAEIADTDVVVIVATKDSTSWALHNGNGTGSAPTAVGVTVNGDRLTGTIDDTIKWNISNDNGNLTIYPNDTTDTWLYCTSTNNGVRVGTNGNKVFTIDAASGYLKNTATSRYLGVYTTNPDWRCYTSSTATNINNQTFSFYVEKTVTDSGEATFYTTNCYNKVTGAQLQIDDSLAIKYYVKLAEGIEDTSLLKMKFTLAGNDATAKIVDSFTMDGNRYVFTYTGIAPQSMADNVKAELIYGEDEVIATLDNYSVKQYVINTIEKNPDNEKLIRLLSDMLHYGAAAQNYLGYKTDNLANDGLEDIILDAKTDTVPDAAKNKTVNDNSNVNLTAAGVRFDYNNKVYIRFTATDISVVTAFVNGVEAEIVEAGGVYTVYSEGITANNFATAQTFDVKVDGVVVLTVNYSVNAYCGVKGNGTNEAAALAKAMYFYGVAAEAYEA